MWFIDLKNSSSSQNYSALFPKLIISSRFKTLEISTRTE